MRLSGPILLAACLLSGPAFSQVPITNVFTEYTRAADSVVYSANSSNYYFGAASGTTKNNQSVIGFSIAAGSFYYNMYVGGSVKIRRVNNNAATGRRSLLWMESVESGNTYRIFPSYTDSMEQFFQGRIINKGTDNLFGNRGDGFGNNNNIERVDWIAAGGMKTMNVSQSGFAVFERGADNQHDPFCIAAITAVNSNGDPSAYGRIVRVGTAQYGNIPSSTLNYTILRKEQSDKHLQKSAAGNQNRGGVLVTLQDLGVQPNQVIYGYSLFAGDLPANAKPVHLVDYSNGTFFPRNTSSDTQEGGIDLIAITGLFNTSTSTVFLPVNIRDFRAVLQDRKAALHWSITSAADCQSICVQKSADCVDWKTVSQQPATAESYLDYGVDRDRQYYRLKVQEVSGRIIYSPVLCLAQPSAAASFQVKRTAVVGSRLHLTVQNTRKEQAHLAWYSLHGQVLLQEDVAIESGTNEIILSTPPCQGAVILQLRTGTNQFAAKIFL